MQPIKWLVDFIDVRLGVKDIYTKELSGYLLPRNVNAWYTLGAVLIVLFKIQIITGILLLMFYVPDAEKAFSSVQYIMNQVPYGWLFRMLHAVGANIIVIALLMHMLSVLFMGSYKGRREFTWLTGFIIFNLTMGLCLTGYLLPWSQLSRSGPPRSPPTRPVPSRWLATTWSSSCVADLRSTTRLWDGSLPCTWSACRWCCSG